MGKKIVLYILLALIFIFNTYTRAVEWGLSITVPEGNWFFFKWDEKYKNHFGFLGLCLEVKIFYTDKDYISIKAGTAIDFILPFPVTYDPVWAFLSITYMLAYF